MERLIRKIVNFFRKNKNDKPSFNIDVRWRKVGGGKGADIWGEDWPIPVAEKLEWSFNIETYSEKQYITTCLTSYILWIIPFRYDMYIYEAPKDTYNIDTIDNRTIADIIALMEKWNWHTDILYNATDEYNAVGILFNKDRWILPLGNNDYIFIKHK